MDEIVNHYEVLVLESNCTTDQVRQKFKQLALKHHPDKLNQPTEQIATDQTAFDRFKQIETAYRILIDGEKRRKYDAEFSFMKSNLPIINEQITVDDLVRTEANEQDDENCSTTSLPNYEYNCRCGGCYRLSSDQFQEMVNKFNQNLILSLMLCCDTCSLYIRIVKGEEDLDN